IAPSYEELRGFSHAGLRYRFLSQSGHEFLLMPMVQSELSDSLDENGDHWEGSLTRSAERDRKVLELFEAAMELPSATRLDWVKLQAGDDADVYRAVLKMLDIDESDVSFLRTGAAGNQLSSVVHPERVGAYRISRVIGEGGMGVVYEGVRDKGDFEHTVAIKVIRPGLFSTALVERFGNERKILASLTHPGIAKLFDGGELENGSPFIVMEYIDGEPISRWIAERSLDERETLELFCDILDAIAHAHQNLIVHRDITPSNVLVTSEGQPKIIDFGIARPQADGSDARESSQSSLVSLSFTPGFAAPEREQGAPPNIVSDVFSLGRLLIALFDGKPVRNDLQAIMDKACKADPSERYASVLMFREDIDAYLTGHPISANPPSPAGKFGYFLKRHPIGAALTGLAITGVVGGLIVTSSLYAIAERERQLATQRFDELHALANTMMFDIYDEIDTLPGATEAKARLAQTAQTYLQSLADDQNAPHDVRLDTALGFKRLAGIQGSPSMGSYQSAEDALQSLEAAERVLLSMNERTPNNPDVRLALGQVYFEQAHIANNPYQDLEKAHQLLNQSIDFLATPSGGDAFTFDLARLTSSGLRASIIGWQDQTELAIAEFDQIIDEARTLSEAHPDSLDLKRSYGSFLRNKAEILTREDRYAEAERVLEEALAQAKSLLEEQPENTQYRRGLAIAQWRMGFTLYNLERYEDALSHYESALQIAEQMVADDPSNENAKSLVVTFSGEMILPLVGLQRFDEAEAVGLKSLAVQQAAFDGAPDVARFQRNMIVQYYQMYELYSKAGNQQRVCESLSELRRYAVLMIETENMAEGDLEAIRGLGADFVACGLEEI
ncbi:MAG: hypothetical protein CMK07_03045, partial [Ponticaulis sp.]|nr:hypothetical protein [Ponticaulis sp.]